MSRVAKTARNLKTVLIWQIVGVVISVISRKIFLSFLSADYLGINGLFSNILSILSLAELGLGTAIAYVLYKPLAENDTEKIKSLMRMFRKYYLVISMVVAGVGLVLTPFLSFFIADMPNIPNLQFIYVLFVVNLAVSYLFTYKRSLIIADQNRYIITNYHYIMFFCLNVVQIIVLILTRNYILFIFMMICATVLENILISIKSNKLYPYLRERDVKPPDIADKKALSKNVSAMMFHRMGGVIVNGTDNLLIAKFVGVLSVGLYSNYLLVLTALNNVFFSFIDSTIASLGNLGATESEEKTYTVFKAHNFLLAWLYGFTAICLFALFNPFIEIWVGRQYAFSMSTVAIIVSNFYINGMRRSVLAFRDAMGLYWYDRYKPIFEIIINLGVSIFLGMKLGLVGILLGTSISTLSTCFWVEPYILFKWGFKKKSFSYFISYIKYTGIVLVAGLLTHLTMCLVGSGGLGNFIIRMVICAIIPNVFFFCVFRKTAEFGYVYQTLIRTFVKKPVKPNVASSQAAPVKAP